MSSPSNQSPALSLHAVRPKRTWRRWCLYQTAWSAFYFTLYALSIGPMFWYWWDAAYAHGPEWVFVFYGPLALLAEYCPPFRDVINAYVNWWILS